MSLQIPTSRVQCDPELVLSNNYHLVHHDLPHVPWFALRDVYTASHVQYRERSGGFLVNDYGEWAKRQAFAPVTNPVHGGLPDVVRIEPTASFALDPESYGYVRVRTAGNGAHSDRTHAAR